MGEPSTAHTSRKPRGKRSLFIGVVVAVLLGGFFWYEGAHAGEPSYGWSKIYGGSLLETGTAVVTDASGNVYSSGVFRGTVNFNPDGGTDTKTAKGNVDAFVTKTNADGSYAWTKTFGGSGVDEAYEVALDTHGGIYVSGKFAGTVNFAADFGGVDDKTSKGGLDAFIAKLSADGTYAWTKTFGGSGTDEARALAVDKNGTAYVGGTYNGVVNFAADFGGTDEVTNGAPLPNSFTAKINPDSSYGWTKAVTQGSASSGLPFYDSALSGLTLDGSGNLYAIGTFSETVNFNTDGGTDSKASRGSRDAYMTKINADASYAWAKTFGSSDAEAGVSITADKNGNVYGTGAFSGSVNFAADFGGTDSKISAGSKDGYIIKVDASGTYGWTAAFGGSQNDSPSKITADGNGNVYTVGSYMGAATFGSETKTSLGDTDAFLLKTGSDGSHKWVRVFGGSGSDLGRGVAVNADNDTYLTGWFKGTVNFGADFGKTDNKTSKGDSDAFLVKVNNFDEYLHKITAAPGLIYQDEAGTNLSTVGTLQENPIVYVRQADGQLLATIGVNLNEDRDWSQARAGYDLTTRKVFVAGLTTAPGANDKLTLYVPKAETDHALTLCPGVANLEDIKTGCADSSVLTLEDANVTAETIDERTFWKVADIADAGAFGMVSPGLHIEETDGSTKVTEWGEGDDISVNLAAKPHAEVTVKLTSTPEQQLNDIKAITFTPDNWNIPRTVSVSAVTTDTLRGDRTATLSYTMASEDQNFHGANGTDVLKVAILDKTQVTLDVVTPKATIIAPENETGEFIIELDRPNTTPAPITVSYTVSGSAVAGTHYAPLSGTATVPAGQNQTTVQVVTNGFQNPAEGEELAVVLALTDTSLPNNVRLGNANKAEIRLVSARIADEGQPTIPAGAETGSPSTGQSSKTWTWLWWTILLAFLLLVGLAWWFLFWRRRKNDEQEETKHPESHGN